MSLAVDDRSKNLCSDLNDLSIHVEASGLDKYPGAPSTAPLCLQPCADFPQLSSMPKQSYIALMPRLVSYISQANVLYFWRTLINLSHFGNVDTSTI